DVVTNNADRKSGHCRFDADDNVWVIDHGLTFHVDHKLRTVIWDFAGRPLPHRLCGDVERALAEVERGALGKTLEDLLSPDEVKVLKRRLRGVLDSRWRFPEPGSAWSIPWPPVYRNRLCYRSRASSVPPGSFVLLPPYWSSRP